MTSNRRSTSCTPTLRQSPSTCANSACSLGNRPLQAVSRSADLQRHEQDLVHEEDRGAAAGCHKALDLARKAVKSRGTI